MKFIPLFIFITIFIFGCDSPGTGEKPLLSLSEDSILFGETFVGQKVSVNLKIENIGKGVLEVNSIKFLEQSKIDYYIYDFQLSTGVSGTPEEFEFPVELEKNEYLSVTIFFEPTEDGKKDAILKITSNDEDNKEVELSVSTRDLYPEIELMEGINRDVTQITIDACPQGWPVVKADSKINICNVGKAPLIITKMEIVDQLTSDQFQWEAINLPAKVINPGLDMSCIENLSICHTAESGTTNSIKIYNNTDGRPEHVLELIAR